MYTSVVVTSKETSLGSQRRENMSPDTLMLLKDFPLNDAGIAIGPVTGTAMGVVNTGAAGVAAAG
jgi:hypothetical protein